MIEIKTGKEERQRKREMEEKGVELGDTVYPASHGIT